MDRITESNRGLEFIDRINPRRLQVTLTSWLHTLDNNLSQWSQDRHWRHVDNRVNRLLRSYRGDAQVQVLLQRYAEAEKEYVITNFQSDGESGRFFHDKVEPPFIALLNTTDPKAVGIFRELVVIIHR